MFAKSSIKVNAVIFAVMVTCAFVYIINAWSPSSYSLALNTIGVETKPDFGHARQIRTDEYWVQTPLTQALVNNHFQRINSTSLYQEDLRINYGLPIFDWGMMFKPALWGYTFLSAPYAFSLYYFSLFSLFVIGYQLFFEKLGLERKSAFVFSIALYFSGAIQAWWTVNASTFAFFPWVMLSIFAIRNNLLYGFSLYYFLVSWQLGNLYPAFSYALGLAGLVWLWKVTERKDLSLKGSVVAALAGGLAVITVWLYFSDYIQMMRDTVYPGLRNVGGGSAISGPMLFSLLVPSALYDADFETVIGHGTTNICEISTFSTLLPSFLIFFTFSKWRFEPSLIVTSFKKNIVPFIIIFIMLLWIVTTVPADAGKYLFLNKVVPNRLMLGFALVVTMLCVVKLVKTQLTVTSTQVVSYWVVYLLVCAIIKQSFDSIKMDIIAAAVTATTMVLLIKTRKSPQIVIICGCCAFSLSTFALFNPLQDARPIFAKHDTEITRRLSEEQKLNGFVLGENLPGAIANGLGFKSVAHVNTTPQLNFWKKKFSDMPAPLFNGIFNRYAHIQLYSEDYISTPSADVIRVPGRCFIKGLDANCGNVDFKN
ncbi:DUF7657 domain-containing protein [Pantoea piersonii]|uniref:DUF7657 domain-containing protein n=1 Tax=Pantoea piersonii TaxID=2364647 RepID=UPI0022F1BCEF|nr:hypothetical protein [Pantoea piersonii]WBV22803.1 hypothetical protein PG877_06520 [Pantoea piersonii]